MDKKKVVAIAGASSGLGWASAQRLAGQGYAVAVCARREELIKELVESIKKQGGQAFGMRADMTRWEDARDFVQSTVNEFGRIDVMFNNAGAGVRFADFDDLSIEEIDGGIAVNLTSVLYGCRAVVPVMKKQKSGHIINTTSILGKRARAGLSVYTAGKHGVDGFSRALFNEVKDHGIKVSILGPAMIATDWAKKAGIQTPFSQGRMLLAEDVAYLVQQLIETPEHYSVWCIDIMALDQTIDPL
ncbi:MAG: SDR family oxidoreductase [Spirochaetota bacterium]